MSFERPKAPRARRGGRALAPGRFPSRGDSVRSRERVARTAPLRRDLCRAGGAGHWQALFRWLPCPAGLFGGRKLGHGVRLDRARALSRGRILGLSPLAGRSAVAPGLPKGAKGMSLALRAALNLRTTRALFSCDQHSEFRAAERCERRPRGPHSRPRRPATANQANRPTPEKPELCSCYFPQAATQTEVCYYERRRAARDSAKRGGPPGPRTWPGCGAARCYESRPTPRTDNPREATAIIQRG